jgi:hypothetical protein
MYFARSRSASSTSGFGGVREYFWIDSFISARKSSCVLSEREMPIRLKRSGSEPSWARL